MRLGKKSQLYLLTAIFLSSLVFLISEMPARTEPGTDESYLLYRNFISEAPHVINGALINDRNISADFDDFTDKYILYSGTKNINLSLFCIIIYKNEMIISNKMGNDLNITTTRGEESLNDGTQLTIAIQNNIRTTIDETDYEFEINPEITDFKAIFITRDNNGKEVYTYG